MTTDPPVAQLSAGLLFGPVPQALVPTITDNVGGRYIGSLRVVPTGSFAAATDVPTEVTIDFYVGSDGHTHVVVGQVTAGGTWDILSDTAVP